MKSFIEHLNAIRQIPVDEWGMHGIGDNPYFRLAKIPHLQRPHYEHRERTIDSVALYEDARSEVLWNFTKPKDDGYLWFMSNQLRAEIASQFPYALIMCTKNTAFTLTDKPRLLESMDQFGTEMQHQNLGFILPWSTGIQHKDLKSLDKIAGYEPRNKSL